MEAGYPRRRALVWAAALGLVVVHVWAPDRPGLIAAVLPWDLAFHLAWMVAAGVLIEVTTRVVWRDVDGGDRD